MPCLQAGIERIERAAGLLAGHGLAAQLKLVAARPRVDMKFLLQKGKIFVELAEKRPGKTIIVESQHDMGHVRSTGSR